VYISHAVDDDVLMVDVEGVCGLARSGRRRRSAEERRRLYRSGALGGTAASELKLLPVSIGEEVTLAKPVEPQPSRTGAIHVELPGRALISLEGDLDPSVVRAVLESLRV
jgi:transposase